MEEGDVTPEKDPGEEKKDAEEKKAPDSEEEKSSSTEREGAEEGDKEPGGSDGESVYQRKLYRENRKLQDQLREQELEKARLEERLKAADKPKEKKIYTKAELRAAVEASQITQEDADKYEEEVILPHRIQQALNKEKEKEAQARPVEKARSKIAQYMELMPELGDRSSQMFQQAAQAFKELVADGLADNEVTEAVALRNAFGSLDDLKRKKEIKSMNRNGIQFHTETPAGGGNRDKGGGATDISKAPAHLKEFWDKTKTSQENRAKEWKIYQRDWASKRA